MDEYRKEMQLKQAKKRSQRKRSNVKGSFTQVLLVIGCGIMCVITGTWRNGISLSTLYRGSMLWPGLSLLVVGYKKGAVFGSLVETPLKPSNKRKYQGTNSTYIFTNISGDPIIYRPTGMHLHMNLLWGFVQTSRYEKMLALSRTEVPGICRW
ncbi:oxidation resistance protein [Trifolium repens]|nr:oxidation resistance protein [Trifolium repens]